MWSAGCCTATKRGILSRSSSLALNTANSDSYRWSTTAPTCMAHRYQLFYNLTSLGCDVDVGQLVDKQLAFMSDCKSLHIFSHSDLCFLVRLDLLILSLSRLPSLVLPCRAQKIRYGDHGLLPQRSWSVQHMHLTHIAVWFGLLGDIKDGCM